MADGPVHVDAQELKKLRKEIRKLKPTSPEYAKRLGVINRSGSTLIVSEAQARARSSGHRYQAKAAKAIKASAAQRAISIRIAKGGDVPYALAAFWGMDRQSGWYGRSRYNASTNPQFLPWVGNKWEVGGSGGPYAINEAIRAKFDEVLDMWSDEIVRLADDMNV